MATGLPVLRKCNFFRASIVALWDYLAGRATVRALHQGNHLILNQHIPPLLGQRAEVTFDGLYTRRMHFGELGRLDWSKTNARGDVVHGVGRYLLLALSAGLMWLAVEEGEGVRVSYFVDTDAMRVGVTYWVGHERPNYSEAMAMRGAGRFRLLAS